MAIVIQNMGEEGQNVWRYEVRINRDVVARFSHYRPDGLEVCLRRAAEAVASAAEQIVPEGKKRGRPRGRVCSFCQGEGHLQPSHGLDYRNCEACKGSGRL